MANAKKCDICGDFFVVPERGDLIYDENMNTSMIRVLRLKTDEACVKHDVMQFDACEKCLQDVIDFMLSKKAAQELAE